jgi:hypothetical protein
MAAGLLCGMLWEFWNYWAATKWIYTVPFFDRFKIFEMTAPGFLGFIPFALECYAMSSLVYLCRSRRGWEHAACSQYRGRRIRPLAAAGMSVSVFLWCLAVFSAMDKTTVDSYRSFIRDLPAIGTENKQQLEACGIILVKDLLRLKSSREGQEKMVRCVSAAQKDLSAWIDTAEMIMLKGMGTVNFQLLAKAGIADIRTLSAQEAPALYRELEKVAAEGPDPARIPDEAKLRIWIAAAQNSVAL